MQLEVEKQREYLPSMSNGQAGWERERLIAAMQSLVLCSPTGCMLCFPPRTSVSAEVADEIPAAENILQAKTK